jgi:gamma-butyrobetaine dioxygenase
MVDELAGLPYGHEPVDQKSHALQAAGHALNDGADDELVTATLLHDIGRHPLVEAAFPDVPHEEAARRFCDHYFGSRVGWLVGAHVAAKRYLVANDPTYLDVLSPASVVSLGDQSGAMTAAEMEEFSAHPFMADAVRLRLWDDRAKVPGVELPSPDLVHQAISAALLHDA